MHAHRVNLRSLESGLFSRDWGREEFEVLALVRTGERLANPVCVASVEGPAGLSVVCVTKSAALSDERVFLARDGPLAGGAWGPSELLTPPDCDQANTVLPSPAFAEDGTLLVGTIPGDLWTVALGGSPA